MSSKLQLLFRSLLEGASRSTRPVFTAASLRAIDPDSYRLLRELKILRDAGILETLEHPSHGSVLVRQVQQRHFLIDPEAPAKDWVPIDGSTLRRCRLDHGALLKWIAKTNGMEGQESPAGEVWTVGTTVIQGTRCRILYYPGTSEADRLLLALRNFSPGRAESETLHVLIVPSAIHLGIADLEWIEAKRLQIEQLYRLVTDQRIDIGQVRLPEFRPKPGNLFRRSGSGWEVGFNTASPRAVLHKSGMAEIWFLLRNPGVPFTAAGIHNELNASESGDAPARSAGTKARSIADLPADVRTQIRELKAEMARARDGNDDHALRDAKEEYRQILKEFGIQDSFAGEASREGDDHLKEAESLARAIKRCLDALQQTAELNELVEHLDDHLDKREPFRYHPPVIPQWRT